MLLVEESVRRSQTKENKTFASNQVGIYGELYWPYSENERENTALFAILSWQILHLHVVVFIYFCSQFNSSSCFIKKRRKGSGTKNVAKKSWKSTILLKLKMILFFLSFDERLAKKYFLSLQSGLL